MVDVTNQRRDHIIARARNRVDGGTLSRLGHRVPTVRLESVVFPAMRWLVARPALADKVLGRLRWGNFLSPERVADPYAFVSIMLDDGYVTFHRALNQWFVLGYEEAQEILRSKSFGVEARLEMLSAVHPYTKLHPETFDLLNSWLVFTDPPDHTRLRRLVSRWFTPGRMEQLRPRVERLVADLIADLQPDLDAGRAVEVMSRFAVPLPVNVVADIIGIPKDHWAEVKVISDDLAKVLDPIRGFDPERVNNQFARFREMILEVAAERRRQPTDDLMSVLTAVADDGDRLSETELVSTVVLLLAAGHETTTGAIGNSLFNLAAQPDQRTMWRNNPDVTENAVEELLRFDTPVVSIGRNALEDADIGGRLIPAGALVIISLGLANRDTRRWPDANELKLDRPDPRPLSFGHGIHHCVGAALARLELQVALPALLNALGDYTVDPAAVEWRQVIVLRSPQRLVVHPGN